VVSVEDGALEAPTSNCGLLERLDDQRRTHVVAQCPADQASAEAVDDCSQVQARPVG